MGEFRHSLTTVSRMIKSHCDAIRGGLSGIKIVAALPAIGRHGCGTSRAEPLNTALRTQGEQVDALTVLRLPPGLFAVRLEGGDDVLDAVVNGVVHGVVRPAGIAVKAFLLILQREHVGR